MDNRVIFSNNGTLVDYSVNLNNYHSGTHTMDFVAANDKLFIGSRYPFNSFYMKMSVVNNIASTMTIDIWDGSAWKATVDLIDESVGFTLSGYTQFVPSKDESGWSRDDTVLTSGTEEITGLGNVTIYDLYWLRISFSADLLASTALSWLGNIFCSDEDLYSEYPMFNSTNLKTAFEAGKTDWEEQRVRATKIIEEDMITQGLIIHPGQILDRVKLKTACISKTAQLIFSALGDDYRDDMKLAFSDYKSRLKKGIYNIDLTGNARLDTIETRWRSGYLVR